MLNWDCSVPRERTTSSIGIVPSLGNPEKGGRTRGKGAGVSWKKGFPQYDASYRSRQRKKDREADRISGLEQDLADLKNLMHEISQRPPSSTHPRSDDPALDLS